MPKPDVKTLEWYDIDALVPWAGNYNEGDVGAIAISILKFGFNSAPRIWKNNEIRAGNHSVLALRSLKARGMKAPQHVRVQGERWLVQGIDVSHLTEDEALAFAIADNRMAERASKDEALLIAYLSKLKAADTPSYEATGYDDEDLTRLMELHELEQTWKPVKTPEELLDFYLNGNIKQVVLYFAPEQYTAVIDQFAALREIHSLETNTDVVLWLLEQVSIEKELRQ